MTGYFLQDSDSLIVLLQQVQHPVQQDHIVLAVRFEFNDIRYHPVHVQPFLSCIPKHLGNAGFREIYTENVMSFSGDKQSISALTASKVKDPAVFLVEVIEKIDHLLERRSANITSLSI